MHPDRRTRAGWGSIRGKGVGEPACAGPATAILGAGHHATGVRAHTRPVLPHRRRGGHRCFSADRGTLSDDWRNEAEKTAPASWRCDACPVLCRIRPGRLRLRPHANEDGKLVRVDPLDALAKPDLARVAFVEGSSAWRG